MDKFISGLNGLEIWIYPVSDATIDVTLIDVGSRRDFAGISDGLLIATMTESEIAYKY